MSQIQASPEEEVKRYLRTGEHDDLFFQAWPGEDLFARARNGNKALRSALTAAVRGRTGHATMPEALATLDVTAFTRERVAPMVRGLFPQSEQETVLGVLARSVIFLTPATIDAVLERTEWLSTTWDLANLYLTSFGAELLGKDAPAIVGLSVGTTCYVSTEYFRATGRFDDFLVHEAAHIFHNCKRRTIGLREIRGREWLLEIDYAKRETFAYACEAYTRILELGAGPPARQKLLAELENGSMPPDERLNAGEYVDILREAVAARSGWKRILQRCARPQRERTAVRMGAPVAATGTRGPLGKS